MRILFWNQLYFPSVGGVEILTAGVASRLIAHGHEVGVVAARLPTSLAGFEIKDGVEIHRFAFHDALVARGGDADSALALLSDTIEGVNRMKRQFRPDVIHINLADASGLIHSGDSQIARSSSSSRHESRNCRQRHASGSP